MTARGVYEREKTGEALAETVFSRNFVTPRNFGMYLYYKSCTTSLVGRRWPL